MIPPVDPSLSGPARKHDHVLLPPEIWGHVLSKLPRYALASCLLVSRVQHDIAQELLFNSISLIMTGGQDGPQQDTGPAFRTQEILLRVVSDPHFASIIREVRVFATEPGLSTWEKSVLPKAISMIPRLRLFHWHYLYGAEDPLIHDEVSICIRSLPPGISELSIPAEFFRYAKELSFHGLARVSLANDMAAPCSSSVEMHNNILNQINNNSPALRDLTLLAKQARELRPCVLHSLTKLVLLNLDSINDISVLLRAAPSLETLELIGHFNEEMLSVLDASLLSRIQRLRIISEKVHIKQPVYSTLGRLMKTKKMPLKSLDIQSRASSCSNLVGLFPVLERIEALSIHLHTKSSDPKEEIRDLARHLSPNLRSLRVDIPAGYDPALFCYFMMCINHCKKLESLLLIVPPVFGLPCVIEDFLHLPRLEMVMLSDRVWELRRTSNGYIITHQWPRWKLCFCSRRDFPSDEAWWLFEYVDTLSLLRAGSLMNGLR